MLSRAIINIIIRKSICSNARTFYYAQNFLQSNFLAHDKSTKEYNIQNQSNLYIVKRFKYIRKKTADDVINNNLFTYICLIFLFFIYIYLLLLINKHTLKYTEKKQG